MYTYKNNILVGTFKIHNWEERKVWRNVATEILIVTDSSGITPKEIGEKTFVSMEDISRYYRSKHLDISIESDTELKGPVLVAGME